MKTRLLITSFLVITNTLMGQLFYDEFGEVVPYLKMEKYKHLANFDEIHSFIIPAINNDSLMKIYNKGQKATRSYCNGIIFDTTEISLKKVGTKIKIQEGTIWVFTIESATAKGLDAFIKKEKLLPETYIAVYSKGIPELETYFDVFTNEHFNGDQPGKHVAIKGNKLIIEYFIPKKISTFFTSWSGRHKIFITNIFYGFRM